MGLALTVALILGASITLGFSTLCCAISLDRPCTGGCRGIAHWPRDQAGACVVGGLILIAAITRGGRATLAACRDSLADSAKSALTAAWPAISAHHRYDDQTGVAPFLWLDHRTRRQSLFLALIMTMLLSICSAPAFDDSDYIITAASQPRAGKTRRALIASHMFAFYYGIMADLSPPVALAALAAARSREKSRQDRLGSDAHRARRLRHSLHLRLFAALMLQAGDPMRFSSASTRGGAGDLQGPGCDRPVRHRRDRLFVHAAELAGNRARFRRGAVPARRFSLQRYAGFALAAAVVLWQCDDVRATRWRRFEPVPRLRRRGQTLSIAGVHAGLDHSIEKPAAGRLARHSAGA